MQDPAREVETQAFAQLLRAELDRRLIEYGAYSEDTFGAISASEAALAAGVYGLLPLALLWLFA